MGQQTKVVTKAIEELPEEEVDAIDIADVFDPRRSNHRLNIWAGMKDKFKAGVARDLTITTTLRAYEHLAVWALPYKPAHKLVKSVALSAVRKSARTDSPAKLAMGVFPMAFKSQALYWLAVFSVTLSVDVWHNKPKSLLVFLKQARHTLFKGLACTTFAALGAAVGTLIRPGIGTQIGLLVAPQFVLIL